VEVMVCVRKLVGVINSVVRDGVCGGWNGLILGIDTILTCNAATQKEHGGQFV